MITIQKPTIDKARVEQLLAEDPDAFDPAELDLVRAGLQKLLEEPEMVEIEVDPTDIRQRQQLLEITQRFLQPGGTDHPRRRQMRDRLLQLMLNDPELRGELAYAYGNKLITLFPELGEDSTFKEGKFIAPSENYNAHLAQQKARGVQ